MSLSTNHMRAFSATRHAETGFKVIYMVEGGGGQPVFMWISGSEQHFGWIRGGAGGESDRRVGLHPMSKMTPDINPKLNSNPKPKTDRVVWAK
jgi:hypothetical protein